MQTSERGLPVTVITGFLGSGKTTLVNHILRNNQGIKTAVIVNEFGDINIDSALIVSSDEDMVELDNGCICCTVRADLVDATMRILEREQKFDHLIVETTGLADPLPVAMTFLGPELRNLTRLDAIVGVVDAENYAPSLFDSETARNQIAYADIVLLNKTDLVDLEKLNQLETQIHELKEEAPILRSEYGQVDLRLILDIGAFKLEEHFEHHDHDHDHHDHDHHEHHHHHHDNEITSVGIEEVGALHSKKFSAWISQLLREQGADIFRMKGIVNIKGEDQRYVFQGVHMQFESLPDKAWGAGPRLNQLVFIGRHLDREALVKGFKACLA